MGGRYEMIVKISVEILQRKINENRTLLPLMYLSYFEVGIQRTVARRLEKSL